MALTTMDAKPALVVIALQKGIVAVPAAHPVGEIAAQAGWSRPARQLPDRILVDTACAATWAGQR